MTQRNIEPNRQNNIVAFSIFTWKAVIIILTIVTSIFSYLAAIDAQAAKCAGQAWVAGYRSGISDFVAFPLISAVAAGAFSMVLTSDRVKRYALWDEREMFKLGSARITFGMGVLFFTLLCGVVVLAGPAAVSVKRYLAISDRCLSGTFI